MNNYPPGCTDEHIDAQSLTNGEEAVIEEACRECGIDECPLSWDECEIVLAAMKDYRSA